MYNKRTKLFIIPAFFFVIMCLTTSCTSTRKTQPNQVTEKVEKLQNNTEYSAVESEWNELYQ